MNEEIVRRGAAASQLLESDAFKTVIAALKRETYETWEKSPADAKDAREDMYFLNVALAHIQLRLKAMVDNAQIEASKG